MLGGKTVVIGITGCIAAYKALDITSKLTKLGANVEVIMTSHAQEFITPLSFESLSRNAVVTDMFERRTEFDVKHISLAKKADLFLVAPATADIVGKLAQGIADDMLTTTYMACTAPKVICPAMNTNMYLDEAFQSNLETLKSRGAYIVEPTIGRLACGDTGVGKLADVDVIVNLVEKILQPVQDYKGKTVLVTAGATEENIDGVRVITNRSSGKMGCAIAKAAAERGAEVILVRGKMSVDTPKEVSKEIKVTSTLDMFDAVKANLENTDVFIMAAAPSDYRIKNASKQKIKAENLTLDLVKNPDIAKWTGENKGDKILVIFSAETEDLIENAVGKLKKKNADIVVANDVTKEGAGFDVDTNIATIIDRYGNRTDSGLVKKTDLASLILDKAAALQ